MKKKHKILLIILAIILIIGIVVGVLAYKNWNTISALYYVATGQTEVVETKKVDTDEKAKEAAKEFGIDNIRPLTDEESQKLQSGELSEQEAIDLVLGRNEENNEDTNTQNPTNGNTSDTNSNTTENVAVQKPSYNGLTEEEYNKKNDEIADLIGKMYVLKSQFTSDIIGIKEWVLDSYVRIPKEQRSASLKARIGKEAYSQAAALEKKCDAEVEEILSRLTVLLKETGQSTSIVSEIRTAYENEKVSTKSYYLSRIDAVK